ncbi:ribonuclease R [Mycoplasma flocculare]|uniref:ribonuclease R n=1 Tax=Mesomycoplasma flocculare TaxID=2128 RepID=UPI00136FF7A1|nr:ribonuclease R [Mesomycoplasma flocculare]MXR13284.1 ribonuclease R [Mesomycoplasma flocculare]MXR22620.1 ribonuclease R [Mesomycoplasma flocculare]MXR55971.1 ribonuclease R [Mesomycoplasma flocculare]
MKIVPEERLKNFLQKERTFIEIVRKFNIPFNLNQKLTSQISNLIENFVIFKTAEGKYYSPKLLRQKVGIYRATQSAFGFVEDKENPIKNKNIFIPARFTANALENDEVRINIYADFLKTDQIFGVITKIIQRNTKFLIGKAFKNGNFWDFEPVNFKGSFFFRWNSIDDLVVDNYYKVKIIDYQKNILKISKIQKIGHKNEPFLYVKIPIIESEVSNEFNTDVIQEASKIEKNVGYIDENRIDLRNELIITIDGEDTKDFDDAISVQETNQGNFLLKVHIADVAHYVKQDSAIDIEAQNRGTSIYLPHTVIPMLPEELSNGICSLKPNVDRFTVTMESLINTKGENLYIKIYPSIINSKWQLTYDQVNNFFAKKFSFNNDNLENMLQIALKLNTVLSQFKKKEGYIDLSIDDVKIILDENGFTKSLKLKKRGISEMLIENFMIRANENVSEFLTKRKIPILYRVHSKPDPEKITDFNQILNALGIKNSLNINTNSKEFAKTIEKIKAENNDNFLKYSILRTMQKAVYSTENIGHFGLAANFYSHFTSPIRRYPDLILHRIIRFFIFEKNKNYDFFKEILNKNSYLTTELEQKAFNLERKIVNIKKTEYAKQLIGQTFSAQITAIIKSGFFVEINGLFDAMVINKNLPDNESDPYQLTEDGFCVYNNKRRFKLGEFIDIKIEGANVWDGKIIAVLA